MTDQQHSEPGEDEFLARLGAASREARQREAGYIAALPSRMAQITDEINERLAGVLPEGMRFEWVPLHGVGEDT